MTITRVLAYVVSSSAILLPIAGTPTAFAGEAPVVPPAAPPAEKKIASVWEEIKSLATGSLRDPADGDNTSKLKSISDKVSQALNAENGKLKNVTGGGKGHLGEGGFALITTGGATLSSFQESKEGESKSSTKPFASAEWIMGHLIHQWTTKSIVDLSFRLSFSDIITEKKEETVGEERKLTSSSSMEAEFSLRCMWRMDTEPVKFNFAEYLEDNQPRFGFVGYVGARKPLSDDANSKEPDEYVQGGVRISLANTCYFEALYSLDKSFPTGEQERQIFRFSMPLYQKDRDTIFIRCEGNFGDGQDVLSASALWSIPASSLGNIFGL